MSKFGFCSSPLGGILNIILFGGIVCIIAYLLKGPSKNPSDTAMEILRKKYAAGEINKEEFEQKKKDLES